MTDRIRKSALVKIAAGAVAMATPFHTVAKGDTLNGISARYRIPVKDLQTANNIKDPNRISIGQIIKFPMPNTAKTRLGKINLDNFNAVSSALHKKFNNSNLEAGILANVYRETGGTFDYGQQELGRTAGGHGIFQYTDSHRRGYFDWLRRNKAKDSLNSQIDYMYSVYGPNRFKRSWNNYMTSKNMSPEQYADWWYKKVETPAHTIESMKSKYDPAKIAKMTAMHNAFIRNMKNVNGMWQYQL